MQSFSGQNWAQRPDELREYIRLLQKQKVKSYLEIGARYGDTFYEVVRNLPVGSTAVAVDLVDGAWGRGDSREYLEKTVKELCKLGYKASVIFGDSTTPSVQQRVAMKHEGKYDCVFIDGDHRYEGLTLDWINYSPMGKLITFHDIDGIGQFERRNGYDVEVPQVWNILKRRFKYKEIVGKKRGMGIGVLFT